MQQRNGRENSAPSRLRYAAALACLAPLSLCFASLVDDPLYVVLQKRAPTLLWLPHSRLSSLLACVALYAAMRRFTALARPVQIPRWRSAWVIALGWICVPTYYVLRTRASGPSIEPRDFGDYVSLLITCLWGEELLFRGMIFDLAEAALPDFRLRRAVPIMLSALLAAFAHLQYHDSLLSSDALRQVVLTLPGCFVYAVLRSYSGSFWLSGGVHFINNSVYLALHFF